MRLVKLPGTEVWVNPEYVTSVRQVQPYTNGEHRGQTRVEVEYEGNAGYRTRREDLYGMQAADVVALIQGDTRC
jgi:hypothetical protein